MFAVILHHGFFGYFIWLGIFLISIIAIHNRRD